MTSVLEDSLIKPLEEERVKFYSLTHQPTTRQCRRLSSFAKLYREDLSASGLPTSTRGRKAVVQDTLRRLARLGCSVLVLYCFCNTATELAKKSYLELTPKLRDWWSSVDHPKRLAVYAEAICKDEGIEYTEPLNNRGPWNNPLSIQDAHTGPVSPPTANTLQNPDEPHHASGTADSTSDISRNNPQFEQASEASLNDLNSPLAPEQRVFENASLQGVAEVFSRDMRSAIRRFTVQDESKAAVTTAFPIWAGTIDCLMSLEVNEWSVEWLVMALFNAKLKWVNQSRHVVFNEGVTLIIPNSEATLKGVLNEAILNVFGPEIHEAVTESPMRRKELAEGMRVTECVSMILTRDGAIINLALGLDGGVKIQNKLYT